MDGAFAAASGPRPRAVEHSRRATLSPVPKRIVITGVSRGLGRALVDGFVARGHIVFGCARSAEAIAELHRRYPSPNGFAVVDVIGSGSGGGKPERVLEIMLDELAKVEFDGEVRIVRFRKATKGR